MQTEEQGESIEDYVRMLPHKGECNDCGQVSSIRPDEVHCSSCGGFMGRRWVVWPK